jgi:hypothetical protein
MRQWMAPVWTKLKDGGGKLKAAWDNGGLDLLSYGVVLLPPLVISLVTTLPLRHVNCAWRATAIRTCDADQHRKPPTGDPRLRHKRPPCLIGKAR